MNLLTGLFRAARKRLLTTDTDMGMFRDKINELVEQKDALSDEEVTKRVDELVGFTNDLPDSDDKAKLSRFLEDFRSVKEQDAAVAKEAGSAVADLFEKLDKEAMQDAPLVEGAAPDTTEAPGEMTTEEIVEETTAPAESTDADPEAEEEIPAEEEVVETEEEAEDADPDPEYSLEEIYQFIKKRMAEDAEAGEETEEEIPEEETGDGAEEVQEEEDDEVVTDHAPRIPVTVTKDHANKGSLAAMFENAKRGTR